MGWKCAFCGKFVPCIAGHFHEYVPYAGLLALEPKEPEPVCCKCNECDKYRPTTHGE